MKAKDLINLLETIDPESDVVMRGFDGVFAESEFILTPCKIKWNVQSPSPHFSPHDCAIWIDDFWKDEDFENDDDGYLLSRINRR